MMIRYIFTTCFLLTGLISFSQLSEEELTAGVERIHRKYLTIDSHNDAPLRLAEKGFDISRKHDAVRDHSTVDFPRMREGGLDAAFFAVFVPQGPRSPEAYTRAKAKADVLIDTLYAVKERNKSIAGIAYDEKNARILRKQGKSIIFIGMENGYPIGKDVSLIREYYQKGIRYITLCHTKNNDICDSSTDTAEFHGLSEFGEQVVKFMNKTGVMIDVSHASDETFYDVLALSKAPVIASHSCAREICDNKRNLDDDMLRALAANGGVLQMCILSDYVKTPLPYPARDSARAEMRKKFSNYDSLPEEKKAEIRREWYAIDEKYPRHLATVSDVVDHIDHIVKIAGIDHVGIGTDFDGGGGVEGCIDVSGMKNITRELLRRGYSEKEIGKIWGGNLLRVMKKCAKTAKKLSPPCNC